MTDHHEPMDMQESDRWSADPEWAGEVWGAFGDWLADHRVRLGLTKRQAAERAGVSPSTWSTLEKGGRRIRGEFVLPSPEDTTLVRIAHALGVDPFELFEECERPWREELAPVVPVPAPMSAGSVLAAIGEDPLLDQDQRDAVAAIYQALVSVKSKPGGSIDSYKRGA